MRFELTPASHRVLERAAQLRLQKGIAAISPAKILWALFEEDECRAAQWLQEAELSLEQFWTAFGIQMLESPIAPPFAQGSYGIPPGQYTPPAPPSPDIVSAHTRNNSPNIGTPYIEQSPQENAEHQHQEEPKPEQLEDVWEPKEPAKYSLYHTPLSGLKTTQSRLQFYLDGQRLNTGLLTPELEDALETAALRFAHQDRQTAIAAGGSVKKITLGMPAFTLTTEHLLFAAVLDNRSVGRWLRDNGFDAAELYHRIDSQTEGRGEESQLNDLTGTPAEHETASKNDAESRLHDRALYRLLDAVANRGREAIRVIEDYVRFILDDADLMKRLKTYRHQFQHALEHFPIEARLESRNTEQDVGTDITAEGEYQRPTVGDLVSANFSRLQESLRSLEEFSKMIDEYAAKKFEQLRYQGYTLHRDVNKSESLSEPPTLSAQHSSTLSAQSALLYNARLYALVDAQSDEETFTQFIAEIIDGGVDIIQLRDKKADDRTLLTRSRLLKNCITASGRKVLFIMNDRPDLALLAEADGVHVGQEELPVMLVRQLVGDLIIGVSTHTIEQARQAVLEGADYIGAGPVFESSTKTFSHFPGLEYLREAAAEIEIPAFAIGGITEERLEAVFQTGIHRIAVGSALLSIIRCGFRERSSER